MHSINVGSVPNYGVCDELRRMVQVCLKSCSRAVRLGAILQVKRAVRKDLSTSWQWAIEGCVQVLQDDYYAVV